MKIHLSLSTFCFRTQTAKQDEVHKHGDNYKRYIVGEKRDERRYSPLRHQGHNRRRKFPMIKSGKPKYEVY